MVKCKRCIHEDVCLFKQQYLALFEKAQEIQPGEELLAIGKPYPFRLDIECTHHRPKTNVLQEAWLKGAGGRISTARYHIG
ncbi:MAG: hypothetical protein ACOX4Q_07230 [Syntrophomonadales bacterium]|jgi:NADPH-dependent 2,4-dienoyl-CoA reductase/sulfur reductase-like enzyme